MRSATAHHCHLCCAGSGRSPSNLVEVMLSLLRSRSHWGAPGGTQLQASISLTQAVAPIASLHDWHKPWAYSAPLAPLLCSCLCVPAQHCSRGRVGALLEQWPLQNTHRGQKGGGQ